MCLKKKVASLVFVFLVLMPKSMQGYAKFLSANIRTSGYHFYPCNHPTCRRRKYITPFSCKQRKQAVYMLQLMSFSFKLSFDRISSQPIRFSIETFEIG